MSLTSQISSLGTRGSFFFQAEDGIRYLLRSRGLGDVYKRQPLARDRPRRGDDHQRGRVVARGGEGGGEALPVDDLSLIHI